MIFHILSFFKSVFVTILSFHSVKQGPTFNTGVKPNPRLIVKHGDRVELRCKAEASPLLDMAYSWRLNGLNIRFFEDDEKDRILTLKNAPSNRLDGGTSLFRSLSEHQRLLQSAKWFHR